MILRLKLMGILLALLVAPLRMMAVLVCPTDTTACGADSVILFRFVPGNRTFYSPFRGNDDAIDRAAGLIERHRAEIEAGHAYLLIRGFCGSFATPRENLAAAKERSNHVKSWFIVHHGMKEDYYRTANSTRSYRGMSDVVALMGLCYAEGYGPGAGLTDSTADKAVADSLPTVTLPVRAATEQADTASEPSAPVDSLPSTDTAGHYPPAGDMSSEASRQSQGASPWYLKSNLVYDALLMPSLEVEYRISDRWSVALEGNMAWWHNDGRHRYYQLATIVPEARYWFGTQGRRRGHYVGLFGGGGWYDLENGGTGYKGEGGLLGLSYGYQFPVGRRLAFEAGIGLGFMTTRYEEYQPLDGHYVYRQTSRFNYFGPLKLKFALVWNIGRMAERKGGDR